MRGLVTIPAVYQSVGILAMDTMPYIDLIRELAARLVAGWWIKTGKKMDADFPRRMGELLESELERLLDIEKE
jgi:hypothetical protein